MKREYAFQKAPRCRATSKRTRERCGAPAERGKAVCRFHGARGGGPLGEANGAYRTGLHTREMVELQRGLAAAVREARGLLRSSTIARRRLRSVGLR